MAKSIMHNKEDRTCYLCMLLRDDFATRRDLQEHHAMPGTANRKLSERYGLKVHLCMEHHTAGPQAVHNNIRLQRLLQANAQISFERKYSHDEWMKIFGRNFI